jgi:hypothetical protein
VEEAALEEDDNEDEEEEEEEDEEVIDEDEDEEDNERKPTATRAIVEVEAIADLVKKNCRCPECNGILLSVIKTTCLATMISLRCKNVSGCGYLYHIPHPAVTSIDAEKNRERMSDYAINCLYVLGFIVSGDGGAEAGKLLGLLGLPNDTTMEKRSFRIIEERIAGGIQSLAHDILQETLFDEVSQSVRRPNDFDVWKQAIEGTLVLDKEQYPKL